MSAPLELACATVRKRPLKGDLYPLVGSSEPQALIDFEITPTGRSWFFWGLDADCSNSLWGYHLTVFSSGSAILYYLK